MNWSGRILLFLVVSTIVFALLSVSVDAQTYVKCPGYDEYEFCQECYSIYKCKELRVDIGGGACIDSPGEPVPEGYVCKDGLFVEAGCGNDVKEPGEECDGTDDSACPGLCGDGCYCWSPPVMSSAKYYWESKTCCCKGNQFCCSTATKCANGAPTCEYPRADEVQGHIICDMFHPVICQASVKYNRDSSQTYCEISGTGCSGTKWLAYGVSSDSGNPKCCGDDGDEDWEQAEGEDRACCYNGNAIESGLHTRSFLCYNGQMYDCKNRLRDDSSVAENMEIWDQVGGLYCQPDATWGTTPPPVCGNNITEWGEECEINDDSACPGYCVPPGFDNECRCVLTMEGETGNCTQSNSSQVLNVTRGEILDFFVNATMPGNETIECSEETCDAWYAVTTWNETQVNVTKLEWDFWYDKWHDSFTVGKHFKCDHFYVIVVNVTNIWGACGIHEEYFTVSCVPGIEAIPKTVNLFLGQVPDEPIFTVFVKNPTDDPVNYEISMIDNSNALAASLWFYNYTDGTKINPDTDKFEVSLDPISEIEYGVVLQRAVKSGAHQIGFVAEDYDNMKTYEDTGTINIFSDSLTEFSFAQIIVMLVFAGLLVIGI